MAESAHHEVMFELHDYCNMLQDLGAAVHWLSMDGADFFKKNGVGLGRAIDHIADELRSKIEQTFLDSDKMRAVADSLDVRHTIGRPHISKAEK